MTPATWNNKIQTVPCAACGAPFEKKPYTRRKWCDRCADFEADCRRAAAAKKRKALPIIKHDGCDCGGCAGVEHVGQ